MTAPKLPQEEAAKSALRRGMPFRRNSKTAPSADQSRRQVHVVQCVWRHFGEPGPVIAFLNTRHSALEAQPLHLAIESEAGLQRVEALLNQMTLKA